MSASPVPISVAPSSDGVATPAPAREQGTDIDLTVVCAIYNEADSLEQLADELIVALDALELRWEVLLVDDGSTDASRRIEAEICGRDPRFRAIHFRRNFGKASTLDAGFRHARGEIIVTMDADLQDDPADVAQLIEPIRDDEADLVSGWKYDRKDPVSKTLPSRIYNLAVRWTTGLDLHDMNCGLKAYRREVTEEITLYGTLHRYIPVIAVGAGFRVTERKTNHRERVHGVSKYGAGRFLRGFLDLLTVLFLTRYRRRPLHLIGGWGMVLGGIGFAILTYLTVLKLMGEAIGHRPLLLLGALLVITAGQMLTFGLLAEMLTYYSHRTHAEYSIRNTIGFEENG